jgi:hypothetical protein
MDINHKLNDHVAFRVGGLVSNDLRVLLAAAAKGVKVTWYTRAQMIFMTTCGPQWEQFSKGPALVFERRPPAGWRGKQWT